MLEIRNALGDIRFSRSVIIRIINDGINLCNDKVILQNYRGKYKRVIAGNDVKVFDSEEGMRIHIYVVMKFGASIKEFTSTIASYVIDNAEKIMGERPSEVRFTITGVQSKEIAKRHIVLSYDSNCSVNTEIINGIK